MVNGNVQAQGTRGVTVRGGSARRIAAQAKAQTAEVSRPPALIPGPPGPPGPTGPQGPTGNLTGIQGSVGSVWELPDNPEVGHAYIIDGELWIYNG